MAEGIDICNAALSRVGESRQITTMDLTSSSARQAYEEVVIKNFQLCETIVLSHYNWTFSRYLYQLVKITIPELNAYKDFYSYPNKVSKIIGVFAGDRLIPYEVMTYRAITDIQGDSDVRVISVDPGYTGLIAKVQLSGIKISLYPAFFVEALILKLASNLAGYFVKGLEGAQLAGSLIREYQLALRIAIAADSSNQYANISSEQDFTSKKMRGLV